MKKISKYLISGCMAALFLGTFFSLNAQPASSEREGTGESAGNSRQPELSAKIYGFIKADYLHASNAVTTFGVGENLLAPTTAKRRVQFDDSHARSQISANQSRFGIAPKVGDRLTGKIEMDFVGGYSASQPNTATVVRMRLAYLDYQLAKGVHVFAGQNWDIFSPLNPSVYNVTGVLFTEGNVGWIREQLGFTIKPVESMAIKAAVGNTTNNGSADPILGHELNGLPTFALSWEYQISDSFLMTLGTIYTDVKYAQPLISDTTRSGDLLGQDLVGGTYTTIHQALTGDQTAQMALAYANYDANRVRKKTSSGVTAGTKWNIGSLLVVSAELYYGQNLGNIRTLGLGRVQSQTIASKMQDNVLGYVTNTGDANLDAGLALLKTTATSPTQYTSIQEAGGWFSIQLNLGKSYHVRTFGGMAKVLNPEDLAATAGVTNLAYAQTNPLSGATGQNMNPIHENGAAGWSFTWNAYKNLAFYFEHKHMVTRYYDGARLTNFRGVSSIDVTNQTMTLNTTGLVPDWAIAPAEETANVYRLGAMFKF